MIIEYSNELYPERLREISNPPTRLYVLGNIEILNEIGIAVVGSRTNTQYGENMCKTFTQSLVEYNINIISGLALGIDGIAHKTCIKNSGKTIAVLPSGFKNIYPETHIPLAKEILQSGGTLVTEYEPDIKVDSKKFKERNRIVAGLGTGTLVVEAGYRSGTSVTARYTQNQSKPVFCVPSSLENMKGRTTNTLIQKGAHLVTNIDDILNKYPNINFEKKAIQKQELYLDIPQELIEVYKAIDTKAQDIDEIAIKTGLPVSEVNYKIVMLEMEGKIKELPGQRFIRNIEDD